MGMASGSASGSASRKGAGKSSAKVTKGKKTKTASQGATVSQQASATEIDRDMKISNEERYRMIQDAAYHLAEKDGFQPGKEQDYWFAAEKQIESMLSERSAGMH
jgi:hypothetical protein